MTFSARCDGLAVHSHAHFVALQSQMKANVWQHIHNIFCTRWSLKYSPNWRCSCIRQWTVSDEMANARERREKKMCMNMCLSDSRVQNTKETEAVHDDESEEQQWQRWHVTLIHTHKKSIEINVKTHAKFVCVAYSVQFIIYIHNDIAITETLKSDVTKEIKGCDDNRNSTHKLDSVNRSRMGSTCIAVALFFRSHIIIWCVCFFSSLRTSTCFVPLMTHITFFFHASCIWCVFIFISLFYHFLTFTQCEHIRRIMIK